MPFTLATPRSEVEPSRPQEAQRTDTTSATNTNAISSTITTNQYSQRQRNSCSNIAHMLRTNSMVRYGTLIFLIALISVLYFATTHQVLKPAGVGPTIAVDIFSYDQNAPNSTDVNDDYPVLGNTQQFDTYDSSTKGIVKQIVEGNLHNNTVNRIKGELYDRGDGCNYNNNSTKLAFPNINFKISLIRSNPASCPIENKIKSSIADKDRAIIFILDDPDDLSSVSQNSYTITVFTIDNTTGDEILKGLNALKSSQSSDDKRILAATLNPYRQLIVSSWLFAMFAVGGILVASFFVSILIHMRLYRLRRNQQDEIRRQRAADEVLGMKKWTLEKEVIDTFPIIIYKKSTSETITESSAPESDNVDSTNDDANPSTNSAEQDENNGSTSTNQQLHRTMSMRSTRSTRSTKSTRSLNAVNNATNLYNSATTPTTPTTPIAPATPTTTVTATVGESTIDDSEADTCAICIEDYVDGEQLRLLPCKHCYHVECIDPWLTTKSSSCPLCKTDCRPNQMDEIALDVPVDSPNQNSNTESERINSNNDNTNVVTRMGRVASKLFGGRGTSVRSSNTQPPSNDSDDNNDNTVVELEMEDINPSRSREE